MASERRWPRVRPPFGRAFFPLESREAGDDEAFAALARRGFDPGRTLFVDDSLPVLDAAAGYGLAAVVAISRPDTRAPLRVVERHPVVEGVVDLLED